MIVVYPLAAQLDYTELRYSIRSLKFLTLPFEVVIIGNNLPDWITNVTNIELPDIPGRVQISVRRKIYAALEYAEEILFMNDDIYLLKDYGSNYYWNGDIKQYTYTGARQAEKELIAMGKQTKNFDLHYPIVFKQDFKAVMENFTDDTLIRSAYCNYLGIEGVQIPDCKILTSKKSGIIKEIIKELPCFSTGIYSLSSALSILQELFPNPSKYEI
jgi:hypothetical protein